MYKMTKISVIRYEDQTKSISIEGEMIKIHEVLLWKQW